MRLTRATGIAGAVVALASLALELGKAIYTGVQEERHRQAMRKIEAAAAARKRAGHCEPRPEQQGTP